MGRSVSGAGTAPIRSAPPSPCTTGGWGTSGRSRSRPTARASRPRAATGRCDPGRAHRRRRRSRSLGHKGDVFSALWSPDGRTLAIAGKDGTLRFWDGATYAPLARSPRTRLGLRDWISAGRSRARFRERGRQGDLVVAHVTRACCPVGPGAHARSPDRVAPSSSRRASRRRVHRRRNEARDRQSRPPHRALGRAHTGESSRLRSTVTMTSCSRSSSSKTSDSSRRAGTARSARGTRRTQRRACAFRRPCSAIASARSTRSQRAPIGARSLRAGGISRCACGIS